MSSQTIEVETKARIKDASRESRLSFRNRAEQLLRRRLKDESLEKCSEQVKSFAECSKDSGLWVVFNCQSNLKAMNACLAEHNSEESWQKYKELHKDELERRSAGKK